MIRRLKYIYFCARTHARARTHAHTHTLGPLVPTEHRLNAAVYLRIVTDHVHPFMTTVRWLLPAG